jgi:transcription-repair coupling factor (superfamily II helicase)
LLVIDEEHRFGVEQKEKLKQFRKLVDVMTLTATPIPRTLHMALSGVRDMSIINTPPENRLPIETYLMPYKPEIVKDAIRRELDRGGQVFFVHNRIQNIMSLAKSIQTLVPQARIAMAHGRMPERQLEQIMIDFVNYQYDILVCTTIIESGLDIPNVNTIIINRADALGLAQLYQLRGRVGRDRYKAYGYLLYPEDRAITENSQKRLRAIEEFTDLGSGFKIALRDLEIRGTGNILGPEQHGYIAAVGYEMYCKILEEAIKELKGEEVTEKFETKINLALEAYLPDEYVPDNRLKMDIYKKLSEAQSEAEIEDLKAELKDRFGEPLAPVRNLLGISDLKRLAQKLGIDAIISSDDAVKVSFEKNYTTVDPRKLINLIRADERLSLSPPVRLMIKIDQIDQKDGLEVINTVKEILNKLRVEG